MFQKVTIQCPYCHVRFSGYYETSINELTCPCCKSKIREDVAAQDPSSRISERPGLLARLFSRLDFAEGLSCNGSIL